MKHWWKVLASGLIAYSIIAGMLVPLSPGILRVHYDRAVSPGDELSLDIVGYNTHWTPDQTVSAYLRHEEQALKAYRIKVFDQDSVRAFFDLPAELPFDKASVLFTAVVDSESDGFAILPDAVAVTLADSTRGGQKWSSEMDLHQRPLMTFPYRSILEETIRNTYYHVPMWFAMTLLFFVSVVLSILYLTSNKVKYDLASQSFIEIGVIYGLLGLITGMLWATYTWGEPWSWDVKQTVSALALLIYLAYFVLRGAFDDADMKARLSSVYSIFAFAAMIALIFVVPRYAQSLHPGAGGNTGLGSEDLDNTMRMVFYPAIIGWILFGTWIALLLYRIRKIKNKFLIDEQAKATKDRPLDSF